MSPVRNSKKTVVLGVCASIAAYKACEIINAFRKKSIDVVVCMSKDADKFITPLTLQTLSGSRVFKDMFEETSEYNTLHISLAERGLILVAPATADIISKAACGICDSLLSSVIVSAKAPVLFVPAMNEAMYNNSIIQENISKLKKCGHHFAGPIKGHLACGVKGIGHIADTEDIIRQALSFLK